MRDCNHCIYIFFIEKICFKSEESTAKEGEVLGPFPANYFFEKIDLKIIFLHTAEALAGRCSVKKVFLEIWQNSQKSTCGKVYFSIKLQALGLRPATLLKKRLWRRCFPVNFAKFRRTPFLIEHLRWLLRTLEFLEIVFFSMDSPNLQL